VDASVLRFLEKFQQNSLLTDVNIDFDLGEEHIDMDILPRVLTKIAPFITSIDSIESGEIDIFEMVYYNTANLCHESQLLLKEMMTKTRILLTNW
jgi:hypothetical protein